MQEKRRTFLLKLAQHDEDKELEFELDSQAVLAVQERFAEMEAFSDELMSLMPNDAVREPPQIVKRT